MAMSVDQKRLRATKFPPEFDKKVDIQKVNIDLMKKWIANKITTILGDEDDIVVETCYNLIEQNQFPNIKEIQIQLIGFLDKETQPFCKELWNLMISAQESPMGVPRELLEAKKLELQQEQLSKADAELRLRNSREQNDMVDSFRRSERSDRPERGRGGRFRGGDDRRGGGRGRYRDMDRGVRRNSRSPPRRRSPPARREKDSYVPGGRGRGGRERSPERRRSPKADRSASPPPRRARRSPSSDRSRTPPRRRVRRSTSSDHSTSPPPRRRRDRSASASNKKSPRRASRSETPITKEKTRSPPPRSLSRSLSRNPPRRRRRSPSNERRRRRSSSALDSRDSPADLKKRKRSPSQSRSRSPHASGRSKRKVTRSPSMDSD